MVKGILFLLLVNCMIIGGRGRGADTRETMPRLVREIFPSALAEEGKTAQIRAFDLAPDAQSIALLYATWGSAQHVPGAELWVAVWQISSNTLVWKQKVGTDTSSGADRIYAVNDLVFTPDQSHLLVLAMKSVWCLDATNGGTPASISSPDGSSGVPVGMWALSARTIAVTYSQNEENSFVTELMDVSSKKKISSWSTPAIPQSFSADGRLAITVTPGYGTVELQVVNTLSGATLHTFPMTVSSGKSHSRESVSAVARFLDGAQVVVAPSNKIDHSGKASAYGLELIDVLNGLLVREMSPQYFRPTGELVVSTDRKKFAVESIYARERDMLLDSLHPKDLKVNLFIFSKDNATPETAIPNVYAGLAGGKGEPLRLSADGSVLAVSESPSESIKVFQVGSPQ